LAESHGSGKESKRRKLDNVFHVIQHKAIRSVCLAKSGHHAHVRQRANNYGAAAPDCTAV
jgi:hypothetical protein